MIHLLAALALFLLLAATPSVPMDVEAADAPSDAQIKAQIILDLPSVVEWPVSAPLPEGKIRLCTISRGEVGHYLEILASRPEHTGNLLFVPAVPLKSIAACHVLFIDRQDAAAVRNVLKAVAGKPILTVGTSEHFARDGGMIGFLQTEKRIGLFSKKNVRFEINVKHTASAGITLDPLLLELAEKLISDTGRAR